jgi:threonine synthase
MDYVSTRGSAPALDFEGVTLAGLAATAGLPAARMAALSARRDRRAGRLPYAELAARVMLPFVGESLTEDRLRELSARPTAASPMPRSRRSAARRAQWLLELFHGPRWRSRTSRCSCSACCSRNSSRAATTLTIVGATSGDTGSAAIDAVAGRDNVDIFMLHPKGRVSDVQRRQMTTVKAPNVHNIAIEGSFDDAQAMVKRMFGDRAMTGRFNIGAVNSINWARLMAQVVYYFAAGCSSAHRNARSPSRCQRATSATSSPAMFAGQMGLPIAQLIVATNVNDILHRALSTGDYSQGTVTPTAAPSMDIQVSSNFERLLFDVGGRDGKALAEQMAGFEATKAMQLTNAQREGSAALFTSARADAGDMSQAIRWAWENSGELIDPHTAIGLHAARAADLPRECPSSRSPPRTRPSSPTRSSAPPASARRCRARRRPVRPRGALRRAARRLCARSPPTSRSTRLRTADG